MTTRSQFFFYSSLFFWSILSPYVHSSLFLATILFIISFLFNLSIYFHLYPIVLSSLLFGHSNASHNEKAFFFLIRIPQSKFLERRMKHRRLMWIQQRKNAYKVAKSLCLYGRGLSTIWIKPVTQLQMEIAFSVSLVRLLFSSILLHSLLSTIFRLVLQSKCGIFGIYLIMHRTWNPYKSLHCPFICAFLVLLLINSRYEINQSPNASIGSANKH